MRGSWIDGVVGGVECIGYSELGGVSYRCGYRR